MDKELILKELKIVVTDFYKTSVIQLPFHGIHHVNFVYNKGVEFAEDLGADVFLVSLACLTHDLNYFVKINSPSESGRELRRKILVSAGVQSEVVDQVEAIVLQASTNTRHADISIEAMALSDSDTLYKALPITPVLFASQFAKEQNMTMFDLSKKILSEQSKLMDDGIYFYSKKASEYLPWARTNLALWKNVFDYYQTDLPDIFDELN